MPQIEVAKPPDGGFFVTFDIEIINRNNFDTTFFGYGLKATSKTGSTISLKLRDSRAPLERERVKPGDKHVTLTIWGKEINMWVPLENFSLVISAGKSKHCELLATMDVGDESLGNASIALQYAGGSPVSVNF